MSARRMPSSFVESVCENRQDSILWLVYYYLARFKRRDGSEPTGSFRCLPGCTLPPSGHRPHLGRSGSVPARVEFELDIPTAGRGSLQVFDVSGRLLRSLISNMSLEPGAAERVGKRFASAFDALAKSPEMGHVREDLTARPVRFWPVYSYLVVYRADTKPLQVLRVLSGYRDIAAPLGPRANAPPKLR